MFLNTHKYSRDGTVVYILGEQNKWVPVSQQRISSAQKVVLSGNYTLRVALKGMITEIVTMNFIVNDKIKSVTCYGLDETGDVYIDVVMGKCFNDHPGNFKSKGTVLKDNSFLIVLLVCFVSLMVKCRD